MARYRNSLPQLSGRLFLTDGGLETTLVFHKGLDLPHFAAFPLLASDDGQAMLRDYFRSYVALAEQFTVGVICETPTWRASPDWGQLLGFDPDALAALNRDATRPIESLREAFTVPIVISGCLGPRGDGYVASTRMTARQAAEYHSLQIEAFAGSEADLITAMTLNYAAEAIGVVMGAQRAGMPVVISFTVETNGRLPDGQSLGDAIDEVDRETGGYPVYYMINCAHPDHLEGVWRAAHPAVKRVRGLRANASRMSHQELNESPVLDAGDPAGLGRDYARLIAEQLPQLNILGGCCGTDERHVEQMARACQPLFPAH